MDVDYVMMAIGSKTDKQLIENNKLELTERGFVKIDQNYMTNQSNVFAGGDFAGGKATVAWACRSGRDAANGIDAWLNE